LTASGFNRLNLNCKNKIVSFSANQASNKKRVVVAMSGGVDSSVAAALLVEQGFDVIGIMMRLWSESIPLKSPVANRCCTPDQMADARRVADHLGIPFYVLDTQSQFRQTIVQQFIDDHNAGLTPNPCIACNRHIRFSFLLQHAQALGAQFLATGHYARIRQTGDHFDLLKGRDPNKDQSYVLYTLTQEKLAQILFPVGDYIKDDVRALARDFSLPVAAKHDSQDLCFVADGDHKGFLQRHNAIGYVQGPIFDQSGKQLGQHAGLPLYTIGQRKGLGISADQPLFVLKKDRARNALIVGPREALERTLFCVRDLNWISGDPVPAEQLVEIKIRYKATAVPGHVYKNMNGTAEIKLAKPARGITPGQGAVFYIDDVCLGGGIITNQHNPTVKEDSISLTQAGGL
jgi:tRNA-specific 2-thiouridylase